MSNALRMDVEERGELAEIPALTRRLALWAADWGDAPLTSAELAVFSRLECIEELRVTDCALPLAPLLRVLPPLCLQRLELRDARSMDVSVVEALGRFASLDFLFVDLRALSVSASRPSLGEVLQPLPRLRNLGLQLGASEAGAYLAELRALSLQELRVELPRLDRECVEAMGALASLEELTLFVSEQVTAVDFSPMRALKALRSFHVDAGAAHLPHVALRDLCLELGLLRMVESSGVIGDWYETGKEVRLREFKPQDGLDDGYPFSLKGGDELTLFSEGQVVFSGTLESEDGSYHRAWTQKGIAPELWESWFTGQLQARARVWRSAPGRVAVLGSIR